MKTYAKTTSERASKGQGGNEFLNVEVLDENQKPILEIKTKPYGENGLTHATIKINDEKIIWQGFLKNTKGKSQKGEICRHCGRIHKNDTALCN